MSKKLLFLTTFILLLSLANNTLAVYYIWDNDKGAGDQLWETAENWDPNGVPVAGDWAELEADYVDEANGLIINADTDVTCEWLTTGYYESPAEGNAVVIMTGGKVNADGYIGFGFVGGNHRFDISAGDVNTGGDFYVTNEGTSDGVVNMTGGTITIGEDLEMGNYDSAAGTFNMSDGYMQVADQIYVGFYSPNPSLFNITGGEVHVFELHIGNTWGDTPVGAGHLKLHGGTINAADFLIGGGGSSSVDVTDGVLITDTDLTVPNGYLFNPGVDSHATQPWTGTLPILIQKGIITAYDVNSGQIITDDVNYPAQAGLRALITVDYDVTNPGKTTLSAMAIDPNLAWNEKPSSGSTWQPPEITLSWSPGLNAASHDVYFGTNYSDVDSGTGGTSKGNQAIDANSYSLGESLTLGQTYYWRIDEVNGVNTWKGIVWNFTVSPGIATNPSPADGASDVSLTTNLSWTPGIEAVSHQLYFSTDFNEVNDRSIAYASPAANSHNPGSLQFDTTYYWAVDEVNNAADVNLWAGNIWQFTTADHLVVDDMESYNGGNEIFDTWIDGYTLNNGSWILLETEIAYDGNSMEFQYDNGTKYTGKYGSRAEASIADLQIGPNWNIGDAKALRLVFYGDPTNSTTVNDRMYIALNDGTNIGVSYYPDVTDINEDSWHQWHINLAQEFSTVNLTNVTKISIGFGTYGGSGSAGGTGTVYFDNIEVWPPYCRSELAEGDVDRDCIVNISDLEIMSADWLIQDYNFIAQLPSDVNLIGWWKLDEGSGDITVDSSIYDNDGNVIEATWVTTGHTGNPGDNALAFDGDAVVYFDHVLCAELEGNSPGTYPAELMPDTFTVSCWTRLDSFEYFSAFVANGSDSGDDECGFYFYNYGYNDDSGQDFGLAIRNEGGMSYVETENIYETDTWYHLATTYDGNYVSIYVDGLLAAGPTDVGGPMRWISAESGNYPLRFTIGAWIDTAWDLYVNAIVDEVRYYDYPMGQGEIAILAETVTPGTDVYQPVPSLANLADPEPMLSRKVNFVDFAVLADNWLTEQLWP